MTCLDFVFFYISNFFLYLKDGVLYFKKIITAVVAERLRRLTRNQIPSWSVGSNPTDCDGNTIVGSTFSIFLFLQLLPKWDAVCKKETGRLVVRAHPGASNFFKIPNWQDSTRLEILVQETKSTDTRIFPTLPNKILKVLRAEWRSGSVLGP